MSQRIETAWSSADAWLWLFPLAYGLHIAEEHWLGFPAWLSGLGRPFVSSSQFLFLNAVCWLLMVAAVLLIRARSSSAWLVVTLAAILGINAGLHLLGSIVTGTYSPGSVTAALLYIPLVVYALRQVLPRVPWPCRAGRDTWRGHSWRRHAPGRQSVCSRGAVSVGR